mgnify:CR=1 FL=1
MTYDELIGHFGSQAAAARALGVKQPSVWAWRNGIPYLRQLDIEQKTGGALKASRGDTEERAA